MTHAYEAQLRRRKRPPIPQDDHSISQKILKVADPGIAPSDKEPAPNPTAVARRGRKPKLEIHSKQKLRKTREPREPHHKKSSLIMGSSGIHATVHVHVSKE